MSRARTNRLSEAQCAQLQVILKARLPHVQEQQRTRFASRVQKHVERYIEDLQCRQNEASHDARRQRLRRMQRHVAGLLREWSAADRKEHETIELALRRHFHDTHTALFYHENLLVYESALRTACKWTRQPRKTFNIEFFVRCLAYDWHLAFGFIPTKTAGGAFDEVAQFTVKSMTDKILHRRNLLGALNLYRWELAVIKAEDAAQQRRARSTSS